MRPLAMEPPVSPAAPTNRTWVFVMLGKRYRSDRYQESRERSRRLSSCVGWGDVRLIDDRWGVEKSRKEREGTGRQNRKSGAGDVINCPPSESTAIHPRMVVQPTLSSIRTVGRVDVSSPRFEGGIFFQSGGKGRHYLRGTAIGGFAHLLSYIGLL